MDFNLNSIGILNTLRLLGILICINLLACQEVKQSVNATYTVTEYRQDLEQLSEIIKEKHPKPFSFQSEEEYTSLLDSLKLTITEQTKLGSFVWQCRTLLASIGCGHSYMPSQGKVVWLPSEYIFPMRIAFIDEKLIILNPMQNQDVIAKGREIQSINGVSSQDLLKRFYKRISADGRNINFKKALINESPSEYIAFELNFPRRYSIESEGQIFQLKSTNIPIPSISPIKACPENLCLQIYDDKNLAILSIRSFHYYGRENKKFTRFIDNAFEKIKKEHITQLVIDIRDNGGGDPYAAAHLLKYLADKDFQYYTDKGLGYDDLRKTIQPFDNSFTGETWILTNGKNFSTSGHFVSLVKSKQFAKFAGTETGSTFTCNANQEEFKLKNTGLIGSIARSTFATAVEQMPENKGIPVDLFIPLSEEDFLQNKDGQLNKLINYLYEN